MVDVLGAVLVLFKAAFAGEDLDRKVGADVVSTLLGGLLRTTSPTDPVLLKVYEIVKNLDSRAYQQAMAAGHRYLAEAQLGTATRAERLKLARERLVDAASAAESMNVPMLVANAEFAVAKCDALLAAPEHAAMALDRAAAALESAIEKLDVHGAGSRLRSLNNARFTQNESVSGWLNRAASGDLVRQRDLDALGRTVDDMQTELQNLTSLYSEVQTAKLGSAGHAQPVVWAQPDGQTVRTGLDAKAVATVRGQDPVRGFGVTVQVEQQQVGRSLGQGIVVELLLRLTLDADRRLYFRGSASPAAARSTRLLPMLRGLSGVHPQLNPGGAATLHLRKGSYHHVLTLPVDSGAVDLVKIRIARTADRGLYADTGACIYVPLQG
ncbi:hypothetical protein Cs7R123_48570 [Catellatospora sp. TT07R-123]|uniref:hypothetical protein n=1 Tax=Catellatospora sp. TT07R-123 TaxID=2733863 RepID=UPI001B0DDEDC|nr:hypothetical protein [Catellatospora sp. TT07R-123]GHJ47515.1 hypothetical protein Cs7R123_48570 [Catellatospora sp. TT07R-123]